MPVGDCAYLEGILNVATPTCDANTGGDCTSLAYYNSDLDKEVSCNSGVMRVAGTLIVRNNTYITADRIEVERSGRMFVGWREGSVGAGPEESMLTSNGHVTYPYSITSRENEVTNVTITLMHDFCGCGAETRDINGTVIWESAIEGCSKMWVVRNNTGEWEQMEDDTGKVTPNEHCVGRVQCEIRSGTSDNVYRFADK